MHRTLPFLSLTSFYIIVACCSSTLASNAELQMSLDNVRKVDSISENVIRTAADANAYVTNAAEAWGLRQPQSEEVLTRQNILSRLATAEFVASHNPQTKISDAQIATAFNHISADLRISTEISLNESTVRAFRIVWGSICPHLFPANENLRPVAASILLYLLVYNGGVSETAIQLSKSASLVRPDYAHAHLAPNTPPISAEQSRQMAYLSALRSLSSQQINDLVEIAVRQLGF